MKFEGFSLLFVVFFCFVLIPKNSDRAHLYSPPCSLPTQDIYGVVEAMEIMIHMAHWTSAFGHFVCIVSENGRRSCLGRLRDSRIVGIDGHLGWFTLGVHRRLGGQ